MQPRVLRSLLRLVLFGVVFTTQSAAQQAQAPPAHTRYKLVDLGTFGGPHSRIPFAQRDLNSAGAVVGIADTDIPDPFAPPCVNPICSVQQGFIWRDGVRTRLLGFFPNLESGAQAINEAGIVVGESATGLIDPASGAPTFHAVLWNKDRFIDLGTLGGPSSDALGVNNRHQVVGGSDTAIVDPASGSAETHAFLWQNGVMHDLGTLGGPLALATDVNERGEVGGFSLTATDPITGQQGSHGFIWQNGRMISLTLGGAFGEGSTLNNLGQAVGHSTLPGDLEDHVVLWDGEKNIDMGTLGGTQSFPTGFTDRGSISGASLTTDDQFLHAALWRRGKIIDLASPPGDSCSLAWGLNSKDQVVGISLPSCDPSTAYAFLWQNGEMVDLNTLIPPDSNLHLVYALQMNDAGEIAGVGVPPDFTLQSLEDVDAVGRAFVLVPVPQDQATVQAPVTTKPKQIAGAITPAEAKQVTARLLAQFRAQQRRNSLPTQFLKQLPTQ